MHRKVAAALVAALALGVASCGGSEGALTRAELVRRIEQACRQGAQVARRAQARAGRDRSGMAFVDSVVAGQRAIADDLQQLDAPDAAKADFDAFRQAVQDRLDVIASVQAAGPSGLQRATQRVQGEAEAITRRLAAAARSLGVEGCS